MKLYAAAALLALAAPSCVGPLNPQTQLEKARQALKARQPDQAVASLRDALSLAEKLPTAMRIETVGEVAPLLWSARRPDLALPPLLAAAKEIESSPQAASPQAAGQVYRWLGLLYRDQRKFADAVPWLERAVAQDRRKPDSSREAMNDKYLRMSSNLAELAEMRCRSGNAAAAALTDRERVEACGFLRNPRSVAACTRDQGACTGGYMQGPKRIW